MDADTDITNFETADIDADTDIKKLIASRIDSRKITDMTRTNRGHSCPPISGFLSDFEDACNFSMYTLLVKQSTPLIILQAQKIYLIILRLNQNAIINKSHFFKAHYKIIIL